MPAILMEAACSNVRPAGFERHRPHRTPAHIFGKRPVSPAEHFVARFELRHVLADCFNRSGKINAQDVSLLVYASPTPIARMTYGVPSTKCQSYGLTDTA